MKEGINEIKIHETNMPEPKDGGSDFQIEKTPELEKLSGEITGVRDAIDHNETVTADKLMEIESSLNDLMVDVGGEKVSIREIRNSENAIIWKEIRNDNFENYEKLTLLTPEIANKLSEREENINLGRVRSISPEIARRLAKGRIERVLSLGGLTEVSELVARELVKHNGELYLNGLTSISKEVATILAEHEVGAVSLGGIHEISDEIVECFSGHDLVVFFGGLTTISEKMAAFMVSRGEDSLYFPHLESISESVAAILAREDGALSFDTLSSISDGVAKALSQHKGVLNLQSLIALSDTAARYLSKHEGTVYLGSYIDISDKAAQYLAKNDIRGLKGKSREKVDKYRNEHD